MIKRFDLVETFNSEIKVHNRLVGTYMVSGDLSQLELLLVDTVT